MDEHLNPTFHSPHPKDSHGYAPGDGHSEWAEVGEDIARDYAESHPGEVYRRLWVGIREVAVMGGQAVTLYSGRGVERFYIPRAAWGQMQAKHESACRAAPLRRGTSLEMLELVAETVGILDAINHPFGVTDCPVWMDPETGQVVET